MDQRKSKSYSVGLIYGSDTGMTEEITHVIVDKCNFLDIDVQVVSEIDRTYFEQYDFIILGLSTWYDGDLQSDWEDYFEEFKTIDFSNKKVALYGLGDQYGYGNYFIDGVGILAEVILANGGKRIGNWPSENYDFSVSKALMDNGKFYGLALDEDNQPGLTENRIGEWLGYIQKELNDLRVCADLV